VYWATLVLVAFALNWLWEMLQMPAYAEMAGRSWSESALRRALAALADVGFTCAAHATGALAAGYLSWGMSGKWNIYATGALVAGAIGTAAEWDAVRSGRWSYTDRMPMVPVLGLGLWPVLQLALLAPLAFAIAAWCAGRIARCGQKGPG